MKDLATINDKLAELREHTGKLFELAWLDELEGELREKVRDISPEHQRQIAEVFAEHRKLITGKAQPFVAVTRKSGPAFRIVKGGAL